MKYIIFNVFRKTFSCEAYVYSRPSSKILRVYYTYILGVRGTRILVYYGIYVFTIFMYVLVFPYFHIASPTGIYPKAGEM